MISILKRHMDRKGRFMAFVTFEDKFNSFEGVVFSSTYEKYAEYLRDGEIVFVTGKVDDAGDQTLKMLVDEVIPMSESRNRMAGSIKLKVDTSNISEDQIDDLYRLIQNSRGSIPLFFNVYTNGNGEALLLKSRRFKVLPTDDFLVEARKILGDSAVEVT